MIRHGLTPILVYIAVFQRARKLIFLPAASSTTMATSLSERSTARQLPTMIFKPGHGRIC